METRALDTGKETAENTQNSIEKQAHIAEEMLYSIKDAGGSGSQVLKEWARE